MFVDRFFFPSRSVDGFKVVSWRVVGPAFSSARPSTLLPYWFKRFPRGSQHFNPSLVGHFIRVYALAWQQSSIKQLIKYKRNGICLGKLCVQTWRNEPVRSWVPCVRLHGSQNVTCHIHIKLEFSRLIKAPFKSKSDPPFKSISSEI